MRIVIDARFYGLENAGLGRYTVGLLSHLSRVDKENDYIVLLRKRYFDLLKFPGNWKKVLAEIPHYTLREQLFLPFILKQQKADMFHALNTSVPVLYFGPFVVTAHDTTQIRFDTKATTLPLPLYYLKFVLYKFVYWWAIKHSIAVCTPSRAVKREIVGMFNVSKTKVYVTYEGVDTQKDTKIIGRDSVLKKFRLEKRQYFLYVGNAYPHKNLKRAIHAIRKVNEGFNKKILFAIVTSRTKFANRIEKNIKKVGAEKFVRILGFVPDNELQVLYRNSLAFVFPTLSEGFGLPGLEAMAAGTLVLSSNIPVLKEIYKENALYFNPIDINEIAERMKDVVKMKVIEREHKILNGQKFVKKYTWDKTAKETTDVYKRAAIKS